MKKKQLIRFFSDRKQGFTHCEKNSEKAKELHTCPYRAHIANDRETLCDCSKEKMCICVADI